MGTMTDEEMIASVEAIWAEAEYDPVISETERVMAFLMADLARRLKAALAR